MFVICTLQNAGSEINGIAFEDHPEGKISVESVSDEVASNFEQIPGYKTVKSKEGKAKAPKEAKTEPTTGEGKGNGV